MPHRTKDESPCRELWHKSHSLIRFILHPHYLIVCCDPCPFALLISIPASDSPMLHVTELSTVVLITGLYKQIFIGTIIFTYRLVYQACKDADMYLHAYPISLNTFSRFWGMQLNPVLSSSSTVILASTHCIRISKWTMEWVTNYRKMHLFEIALGLFSLWVFCAKMHLSRFLNMFQKQQ